MARRIYIPPQAAALLNTEDVSLWGTGIAALPGPSASVHSGTVTRLYSSAPSLTPEVPDGAMCAVCREAFDDPVTVHGCGHSFCRECFYGCWEATQQCPSCRGDLKHADSPAQCSSTALDLRRIVEAVVQVKCIHEGCATTLPIARIKEHEEACAHKPIGCPCCAQVHPTKDLPTHLATCTPSTVDAAVGAKIQEETARMSKEIAALQAQLDAMTVAASAAENASGIPKKKRTRGNAAAAAAAAAVAERAASAAEGAAAGAAEAEEAVEAGGAEETTVASRLRRRAGKEPASSSGGAGAGDAARGDSIWGTRRPRGADGAKPHSSRARRHAPAPAAPAAPARAKKGANLPEWIGDPVRSTPSQVYFDCFSKDGCEYRVGDCIYMLPESEGELMYLAKINAMWEEVDSCRRLIAAQWFERAPPGAVGGGGGASTSRAGGAAARTPQGRLQGVLARRRLEVHPREVFLTDMMDPNELQSVEGKAVVLAEEDYRAALETGARPLGKAVDPCDVFMCRRAFLPGEGRVTDL